MSSMKRFLSFALVVAGAALPGCAQRGGSHGGSIGHSGGSIGHSGGFTMRGAPPSRPSLPAMGRTSFMGASQLRYGNSREINTARRGPIRGDQYAGYRNSEHRFPRSYRPVYGYGSSLVYAPNYLDAGDLDFLDYPSDDASTYPAQQQAPPAPYSLNESELPLDPAQAQGPPPDAYRTPYLRAQPAQDLGTEIPVTLIYKDGRPSEQIQNYMLTRTTLYVQEQRLREIPVADLDLLATQTANKAVGIDFQLPGSVR